MSRLNETSIDTVEKTSMKTLIRSDGNQISSSTKSLASSTKLKSNDNAEHKKKSAFKAAFGGLATLGRRLRSNATLTKY